VAALATVDATAEPALAARLGAASFPTLLLYRGGAPEPFPALATAEAYAAALARLLDVPGAAALSPAKLVADGARGADFASWLFWRGADGGKLATTLVLFSPRGAPAPAALADAFEGAAADLLRDPALRFARVESAAAMADLEMAAAPELVLYTEHDEGRHVYAGAPDAAAVRAWLVARAVPLAALVTHKTLPRYRAAVGALALLFVEEAQTEHLPTLRAVLDAAHAAVYALEAEGAVARGNFTLAIADGKKYAAWRAHFLGPDAARAPLPALALDAAPRAEGAAARLFAFADAGGAWAADVACGPAARARAGAAGKWVVELASACGSAAVDARGGIAAADPPLGGDKREPLAVTALAFSPDAVAQMTDFLRAALRGEIPRVPSVRVDTPFGAAVA